MRRAGADEVGGEADEWAVELCGHALSGFGVHPLRARQMTWAVINNEKSHEDELFDAWKEIEEGIRFSPRYGELFMKLEDTLSDVMRQDWEPPSRGEGPLWSPHRTDE